MQFTSNGPDIPDALLQAHEEGCVVFFCGAGISYPAGLPGFNGLVEQIYQLNGTQQSPIESEAFERKQFDRVLELLERRLPGQRLAVRSKLAHALKPNLRRKSATETHDALLRLGRSRDGTLRLVTTNFDRLFHSAAKRAGHVLEAYAAPMLPVPKNSRWDGLVYLHGLLPAKPDDAALNRLVVTSGDFGLAYLTERWAARFVSELFRNYMVCFVGYSIDDPVLRYMMDALAADRMQGETTPQAWALGECEPGCEERKALEWKAKGVVPILYRVPAGTNDHSALHLTLKEWAEAYRVGVQGKEAVVVAYAMAMPQGSTKQDDFVGRMLWALSDKSGLPAKLFADYNPAPSLDWLFDAFSDERFEHGDLLRFGVPPDSVADNKLRFSLISRPAPYDLAQPLGLISNSFNSDRLDNTMFHLARWLTRHLDDPRLIIWIANQGGRPNGLFNAQISERLNDLVSLERDGKASELDEIRAQSPNAIPSPFMRKLWRLLLSGRVKTFRRDSSLYGWTKRFQLEGLTTSLRLELRSLLEPKLALKKPFNWGDETANPDEAAEINQSVVWELVLQANDVRAALADIADVRWTLALPKLIDDFQQLLRDGLDLMRELDDADEEYDRSHWDLPSIAHHWQNSGYSDWVTLIELVRDAWLVILRNDKDRAVRVASAWFDLPYSTFKRLALFAASHETCIPTKQWAGWLLESEARCLWSTGTKREMFRLLVLNGQQLSTVEQKQLEVAILAGPPREMYKGDLKSDDWQGLVSRFIWLRLAKLNESGLTLGAQASVRFAEISCEFPQWRLANNESDEFSFWTSGTGDPDFEESRDIDIAPRKWKDLVQWLAKARPAQRPFYEDTWRDICRTRFFHSLLALRDLGHRGVWPVERWREALQVWAGEGMVLRSWRNAASLVQSMPDAEFQEIIHSVTGWLEAASKSAIPHGDFILEMCRRVIDLPLDVGKGVLITRNGVDSYNPVTSAINHPIGHVTQALINLWARQDANDNDLLSDDIKPFFTDLCDVQVARFRHGRVVMGSRLIAFFRVDRPWTEQYLLPLLNWSNPSEAGAVWEGFLWSPRLHRPLLMAFKWQFLETARHYRELGEHRQQFSRFLTHAALGPIEGYTYEEFRSAFAALPQAGLEECALALYQAAEASAGQSEEFWKNRAQLFWQWIWPKSRELASPRISESLLRLVIAAKGELPTALATVKDWLKPIEYLNYIFDVLLKSNLCKRFPTDTLLMLNAVVADQQWAPQELGQCLDQIRQASPNLASDTRFLRLQEFFRIKGT